MLKTLLQLSLLTTAMAACDPAWRTPEDLAEEPGAGATEPVAGEEQPGNLPSAGDGPIALAGAIDFGPEPKGAAALSTLSCPALTMPGPAGAATVYVDAKAIGTEAGTKAAPFRTIAKAFASAAPKAVIWVARGKYEEQVFIPNKGLTVLGGFAPGFGSRDSACGTILEAPNDYAPVLTASGKVKSFAMEGLTVRKGVRGLLVLGESKAQASFTIARSVFEENGDTKAVGGAVLFDGVNARVFRSVFRANQASKGAALASSGDVTLTVDQNLFQDNRGYSDHGGGLYISARSSKLSFNTFRGNATGVARNGGRGAGGWGGAVIVYSNSLSETAKADFSFNVFTENVAGIGGAVFVDDGAVVTMSHDLLYRNRSYPEGGFLRGAAIYVDGTGYPGGGSTLTAEYLTVVNNVYDDVGASGTPTFGGNAYVEGFSKATFTNSIFWNNGDDAFFVADGQNELTVDNSIGASRCASQSAQGPLPASATSCKIGAGVFQPEGMYFGDEAADDYHEKSAAGRFFKGAWLKDAVTSPAIDHADPAAAVDSEPMPNGNRANLGAFSRTSEASMSP